MNKWIDAKQQKPSEGEIVMAIDMNDQTLNPLNPSLSGVPLCLKSAGSRPPALDAMRSHPLDALTRTTKTERNMSKKYELLKDDCIEYDGRTLYRIRALRDF